MSVVAFFISVSNDLLYNLYSLKTSQGPALEPELGLESTGDSLVAGSLSMGLSWAEGIIRDQSRHVPW